MPENINNENKIEKEPVVTAVYIDNSKADVAYIGFTMGEIQTLSQCCVTVL